MFNSRLENAVTGVAGSYAAILMGFDGIAVDSYVADGSDTDIETIGMEFSVLLNEVRKAASQLDAGSAREMTIRTEKISTILRSVNEDYFVAITLGPDGNLGKARYLLRILAPEFNRELS
jgi:predicted regulator of Ras-like GTPase activity (Roadblock/LC7/MglB family)